MMKTLSFSLILLWIALPTSMWAFRLITRKKLHGALLYLVCLLGGYVLFVGCAWAADVAATQEMNRFDLDGDGGFSGDELTPEAQAAIDNWASDTGRTLAFMTGVPLTAIWAAICLGPLCFLQWLVRRIGAPPPQEPEASENASQPREGGNSYEPPGTESC